MQYWVGSFRISAIDFVDWWLRRKTIKDATALFWQLRPSLGILVDAQSKSPTNNSILSKLYWKTIKKRRCVFLIVALAVRHPLASPTTKYTLYAYTHKLLTIKILWHWLSATCTCMRKACICRRSQRLSNGERYYQKNAAAFFDSFSVKLRQYRVASRRLWLRVDKNTERWAQLPEKRGGVFDGFAAQSSIDKINNRYPLKEPTQYCIKTYKRRALAERELV